MVFHVRKHVADVAVQSINTPRGTVTVSTPEATAFDLIGYETKIGGLDAVATVLDDLAEKLDPRKFAAALLSSSSSSGPPHVIPRILISCK